MADDYAGEVEFLVVYIREAHPTDGRQSQANVRDDILFAQPLTLEQRSAIAAEMCSTLDLRIPTVIDLLDDRVGRLYEGMPDRMYVIGSDGRVVYRSARGPRGFQPEEAEAALLAYLLTQ